MQTICMDVGGFKLVRNASKIDEEFKNSDIGYIENSDVGYFFKVDLEYPKELCDLHSDLPFLPEKMEINEHDKLVCTLYDKKRYAAHIRNTKQALNHGLTLSKVHKAIAFY